MSHYSANIDDFGIDSLSLAGSLQARLTATQDAGFSQIMLCATDLVNHPEGVAAAVAAVRKSGLRVTGLQTLRDFEGLSGPLQRYKTDVAKSMLEMCQALGCHLLVASATTLVQACATPSTLVANLRQLSMLGIPKNIRIAFKANASAQTILDFGQAWDLVCQADMPNLGLCLDAGDMLASTAPQEELDFLDPEKLFLVQLADCMDSTSPSFRLFPGEGAHSEALAGLVTSLHGLGYRGDYSLAVVNDDYRQMPPSGVAQRAWASAVWLGQDVLQRSVPLPNQIRLKRTLAA